MTLQEKIAQHRFVVCAEIAPPQGCDGNAIREKVKCLHGCVDAVNITDNQTAIVRLSSMAAAKIILDEGMEPIMQMTCRDRNRLAIQSDLLGAAALGIRNLLCVTGDHQSIGDQPEARGVFDLDSIQLIAAVATMNSGFLLSGTELTGPPAYFIGAAANPCAEPMEMRLIRLDKKIRAGARFIQTQPVFDLERFSLWLERVAAMGLHEHAAILPGIMPVRSAKTLLWMKKNVPGMRIHPDCIRRLSVARNPEEEGLRLAVETIDALKGMQGVRGIHIMPARWENITPTLVKEANLQPAN